MGCAWSTDRNMDRGTKGHVDWHFLLAKPLVTGTGWAEVILLKAERRAAMMWAQLVAAFLLAALASSSAEPAVSRRLLTVQAAHRQLLHSVGKKGVTNQDFIEAVREDNRTVSTYLLHKLRAEQTPPNQQNITYLLTKLNVYVLIKLITTADPVGGVSCSAHLLVPAPAVVLSSRLCTTWLVLFLHTAANSSTGPAGTILSPTRAAC